MTNRRIILALLLSFAIGMGYSPAQSAAVKVVYRNGNDLFTIGADGKPKPLTNDGIPKENPLWSKDGTKIAFLRKIDEGIALNNLIVVDQDTGKTIADIRICPNIPKEIYDVRYIANIEWLSEDKIAANGSINPSSGQTFVYDIRTGKEMMDYLDDNGGAIFSQDGEHAATLNGMQHFLQEQDREPELEIDNLHIYPAKGIHPIFLSDPTWSEDSTKVAVVAEDYQSKQRSIVICGLKGDCKSTALSTTSSDPDDRFRIQWNGSRVSVTFPEVILPLQHGSSPEATWSLHQGDIGAEASPTLQDLKPNAYDTPLDRQNKIQSLGGNTALNLLNQIQKLGGIEPDFWCKDCALAKLPRKSQHM
jgi:hypothetical protein